METMNTSPAFTMLQVHGMTCGGCEKAVVRAASAIAHVSSATADRQANSMTIHWAPGLALEEQRQSLAKVCEAIDAAGFECQPVN
jgi:cation transport ATPase